MVIMQIRRITTADGHDLVSAENAGGLSVFLDLEVRFVFAPNKLDWMAFCRLKRTSYTVDPGNGNAHW